MFPESKLVIAANRFDEANGRKLEPFMMEAMRDSGLAGIEPRILADQIRHSLDSNLDLSVGYRSAAFWALGKHYDSDLLEFFRRHLVREIANDMKVAYQIMIALDNLGETVWPATQRSLGVLETEQNREAAVRYLNECA